MGQRSRETRPWSSRVESSRVESSRVESSRVESIRIRTHGLGGDSEIRIDSRGDKARLTIGPSRITPLARFAMDNPALTHSTLDRQLSGEPPSNLDGTSLTITDSRHDARGLNKTDTESSKPLPLWAHHCSIR